MELSIFLDGHERCTIENCQSSNQTKCKTVAVFGQTPTFYIDDYPLYEVDGVVQVGVQPRDNYGWDVAYSLSPPSTTKQVYFCVDTIYNETWPHWVAESAIYLPLFHQLKEIYPSLKLFSLRKKVFKVPMYRACGISEEDIVFSIDTLDNKFVFPHYISLADHRLPFLFTKHMKNFYTFIRNKCPTSEKDIDILYLPRGTKENSKGTDRIIPVQSALIEFLSGVQNVKIFYTDDTQNMIDQWDTVKRAKVIIVNEGGNHGINGFFADNSKIIVLGGHGSGAHFQNPSPALVYYDSVNRGNKYYHIDYNLPVSIVLNFMAMVIHDQISPIPTPKVSCWRECLFCKYQEYSKRPLVHSI